MARFRERCKCGAEFEVEDLSHTDASEYLRQWRARHLAVCQHVTVDLPAPYRWMATSGDHQ